MRRHRAEALRNIATRDRLLAEIERDRLTATRRNTSERSIITHNRHVAEMERNLAEYKHHRDEALQHISEAKRLTGAR